MLLLRGWLGVGLLLVLPRCWCASGWVVLHEVRGLSQDACYVDLLWWLCVGLLVDESPQLRFSLVPRVVVRFTQPKFQKLAFYPLLVGLGVCPAVALVDSGQWRVHTLPPVGVRRACL